MAAIKKKDEDGWSSRLDGSVLVASPCNDNLATHDHKPFARLLPDTATSTKLTLVDLCNKRYINYLPQLVFQQQDKIMSKLRSVFNASCKKIKIFLRITIFSAAH